jgi:hypothetical protein
MFLHSLTPGQSRNTRTITPELPPWSGPHDGLRRFRHPGDATRPLSTDQTRARGPALKTAEATTSLPHWAHTSLLNLLNARTLTPGPSTSPACSASPGVASPGTSIQERHAHFQQRFARTGVRTSVAPGPWGSRSPGSRRDPLWTGCYGLPRRRCGWSRPASDPPHSMSSCAAPRRDGRDR